MNASSKKGLKIALISGIYKHYDFHKNFDFSDQLTQSEKHSAYHVTAKVLFKNAIMQINS